MDISSKTIKLKDNKTENCLDSARFTLNYSQSKDPQAGRLFTYRLLSLLKGSSDVIMEINSDLLVSNEKSKSDIIQFYVEYAKKLGLNYRYRKLPSSGSKSFFGKLLNQQKQQEAHELVIHIPAGIWEMEGFCDYINTCGTRYYFTGSEKFSGDLPDEMSKMTDNDKFNFFKMVVFDVSIMGNMGINSKTMELIDLKKLLKLSW